MIIRELRPCQNCGSSHVEESYFQDMGMSRSYYISCRWCMKDTWKCGPQAHTRMEARKLWNLTEWGAIKYSFHWNYIFPPIKLKKID